MPMSAPATTPRSAHCSALAEPGWSYIEKVSLEDFSGEDWRQLEVQRSAYLAQQQATQVLRLLGGLP